MSKAKQKQVREKQVQGNQTRVSDDKARHEPLLAILFMGVAVTIAPIVDTIAKLLSSEIPVIEITWARFVGHVLFLAPFALYVHGPKAYFRPAKAKLQLLRGAALAWSTTCFFFAISTIPLADALAITFIESFFVVVFAVIFLGERVGLRRSLAVILGFIGVLIVLRPGTSHLQTGHLWALASGLGYGIYFFLSRFLSGKSPSLITMAHTGVVGAIVLSFLVPFVWVTPTEPWQIIALVCMGGITAIVHGFFQLSFERGEASFMAAFTYAEIISMTMFGLYVFGDFPDNWTWLGVAILVSAGVFVAWREHKSTP